MEFNSQAIYQQSQSSKTTPTPHLKHVTHTPQHHEQARSFGPSPYQHLSSPPLPYNTPPTTLAPIENQHQKFYSQETIHPAPHAFPIGRTEKTPLIPFAPLIIKLIEEERLPSARKMLSLALQSNPSEREYIKLAKLLSPPPASLTTKTDKNRSPEYLWIHQNSHFYKGKWIAVSGSQLVAAATTLRELMKIIKDSGIKSPLVHKVG